MTSSSMASGSHNFMMRTSSPQLLTAPLPDRSLIMADVDMGECGLETLYPVALLITELRSDDLQVRLDAVKKIPKIAEKLGHERTRKEILPFFSEVLCDGEDVLYALAELLGNFVHLIGGRQYAQLLLPPLERLASMDDARVRNRAVLSLRILALSHTQQNLEVHYIPMVKKLGKSPKTHARIAACSLLSACYKRVSTTARSDLRTTYRMLSVDKTTDVREAAADNLGELARVMEAEYLRSFIMPIFLAFAHDKDDTVRVLTILACYKISQVLSVKYKEQLLLSVLRDVVHDPSWRVRVEMASRIVQLQKGLGPELSRKLVDIFVTLLTDNEACVRVMTLSKIIRFARRLDRKAQASFIIKSVMPHMGLLINDPSKQVQMTLAAMTNAFCGLVGKADTMEYVVPIIMEQMSSDCPQARSAVVSRLDIVFDMIGAKNFVQLLLPSVVECCGDVSWETRFSVIDMMPSLAVQLGVEVFDEKLTQPCLEFLQDPVFMVRDKAVKVLRTLVEQFGVEWGDRVIVPKLMELTAHSSCFKRMTVLFVISKIVDLCNADVATKQFLPLVVQLAEDNVPNIRLNVAKTVKSLGPMVEPEMLESQLKPLIEKLVTDADIDVKYFAQETREELFPELDG